MTLTNSNAAFVRSFHISFSSMQLLTAFSPSSEEEVMEREEDLGPPDCHDATDLICGLIRELSSLKLVLFSLF